PELYAEYLELGVDCVLHSFHDAGKKKKVLSTVIAPPTLQGHAGNYVMWLSVANNSASYQAFPSMMIDPMGIINSKTQRHVTDVIVNDIDLSEYDEYMNMVRSFRSQARTGEVYQPNYVDDVRSS